MTKIDHLLVASGLSAKKVAHALAHGKVLLSGRRRLQLVGPEFNINECREHVGESFDKRCRKKNLIRHENDRNNIDKVKIHAAVL